MPTVTRTLRERKLVTIMFVDMVESLAAIRNSDPEEAHEIFAGALAVMTDAIHASGGVVTRALGDGVMAVFGAPAAQEDHAARACHAAIDLHARLASGYPVSSITPVRIGIHSGEVALGGSPNDFAVDYDATGAVVHIAARLQSFAPPGGTALTAATRAFLTEDLATEPIGPLKLKGLEEPVDAFVLAPASQNQPRPLRFAADEFIGRTAAIEVLEAACRSAMAGRGLLVGISGEAGVGKTSLINRFLWRHDGSLKIAVSAAERYGRAAPLQPVRNILIGLFTPAAAATAAPGSGRSEQVPTFPDSLSARHRLALQELMDPAGPGSARSGLPPREWRDLIASAISEALLKESERSPLLIAIEDLQRADSATIDLIATLAGVAPLGHLLILVSFRRDFKHNWSGKAGYTELELDRLTVAETKLLIRRLIGDAAIPSLEKRILDRIGGNPLFLRETARTLIEEGIVGGPPGARILLKEGWHLSVPLSVSGTIAERIDRLPARAKDVLLVASVLGVEFSPLILSMIVDSPAEAIRSEIETLERAEFVRRLGPAQGERYTLAHDLFQEVAYAMLLKRRRQTLHGAAFRALKGDAAADNPRPTERLAHHAFNGELWDAAVTYCREAGRRAAERFSLQEAAAHLENAITALARTDIEGRRLREAIDIRLEARLAYLPLLRLERIEELLVEAETAAQRLADRARLAQIIGFLAGLAYLRESPEQCIRLCRRAIGIAARYPGGSLEITPHFHLAQAQYALGKCRQTIETLQRIPSGSDPSLSASSSGLPGRPAVMASYWIAISKAEIGSFDEAQSIASRMLAFEPGLTPFEYVYAETAVGFVLMVRGDYYPALGASERALEALDRGDAPFMVPVVASQVGWLLAAVGKAHEGAALARRAVRAMEDVGIYSGRSRWFARLAEALLLSGQFEEAFEQAELAFKVAEHAGEYGYLCSALRLRSRIGVELGHAAEQARADLARAIVIARKLALGPTVAKCHFERGTLEMRLGQATAARRSLLAARNAFCRYQMSSWATRTEQKL
ncbi:MAG: ATP-binding protein [Acetobacteraceae bacterium]